MSTRRAFVLIFIAALLVRVTAMFAFDGEQSLLYLDSHTYIQAAKNMLTYGMYSMGYDTPPTPDSFRTPLYPLILLPFVKFGISWYVLAVIQAIAMSFAAGFAFLLGIKIFSERIAFWGALLFAVEPFGALIGTQVMTEAFFSLLFIAALYSFARYTRDTQPKQLILGAVALAFAALLKQFALFFGIFIIVAFFMSSVRPRQWRTLVAALGVFVAILSPWIIRNRIMLHTWDFSSQSGYNLYAYNARYFSFWLQAHFPGRIAQKQVFLEYNDRASLNDRYDTSEVPHMQEAAMRFIGSYPLLYTIFHVEHMPLLFTNSAYNNLLYAISPLGFSYSAERALYKDIGTFHFWDAARRVAEHPVLILALSANMFFMLVALLALMSPFIERRREGSVRKTTIFFVAIIIFYSLLSSPINGARLRIPLNPVLFMLALHSVMLLRSKDKSSAPIAIVAPPLEKEE